MWVFTKDGFYSAVEHRGDKRMVCVRARVRQDLVNLRAKLPGASRIVTTPDADYAFRVVVDKRRWGGYVAAAARNIDYDNFKNATTLECPHRSQAYHAVWSAMEHLQRLPSSGTRGNTMQNQETLSSAPMHGIVRLPSPYYDEDGITIYCADCLEILPFIESVDVTFSSPPYNTIAATNPSGMMAEHNHKLNKGYDGFSDDMPEMEYQAWMREVFGLCRAVSKGLVWINHKTRYREKQGVHPLTIFNWPFYSELVWDRGGSITMNARKFAPSHEYIYGFGVPHYWDNAVNTMMSVWRIMPERDVKGHPCPFPVSIASRCITASCPEGGVVLDPFLGSGTTLLAARQEGRRGIGIEINPKYCDVAIERLRQKTLF